MPNIICRGLSFGYDGSNQTIFNDLDLTIDTGWRSALVGANGRGKTTLLRLLAGELAPDRGEIERPLDCRLFGARLQTLPSSLESTSASPSAWEAARAAAGPYRELERRLESLLASGGEPALARYAELEFRYAALGGYELDAMLERELEALAIGAALRSRPYGTLSGGEQTRCLLAGLFAGSSGFPLIDEPTNHLDLDGRRAVAAYLAGKSGFVLVSHDRAFLDDCTDHVIALNPDTVEVQRLGYSAWRAVHQARLDEQARTNQTLRKEIRRLEITADQRRRGAAAREKDKTAHVDKGFVGARAARQMKRALAAERRARRAAESRRESLTDVEKSYDLRLCAMPTSVARHAELISATNLVVRRGGALFAPVSFSVRPRERLALLGGNGSGKTSLMDLIAGAVLDHEGVLNRPGHVRVSRAAQRPRWRSGRLVERLAVAGLDETRFRQIMAALGVRGEILDLPLEVLSEGQLKKVELARSLLEPAHVLLWDEPLNYVDVDTRERIETLLGEAAADAPALIFVEHDARFVATVATATVVLERPRED